MSIFSRIFGGGGVDNTGGIRAQLSAGRGNFSDLINQLVSRGEGISEQPRLTSQDMFGEVMQRLNDSIGQSANATKQALSRSIMGRGGDISGAAGANILGVNQQASEDMGRTALQFENLTQGQNNRRESRADRLLSLGLQGLQSLFGMDQSRLQDQAMQDQAKADRRSNIFGNILQAGSTVAAAALCWVAEELYGTDSNEFHSIRGVLLEHEKTGGELAEFTQAYREHGEQWAQEIKEDPVKRLKTEALFDKLYEYSQSE